MDIIEFISQPWHWSISGIMLAVVVFLLLFAGEKFGMSSSFETLCAIGGAGKRVPFFNKDWRKDSWLLVMVVGSMIGGWLATTLLQSPAPVQIAESTAQNLHALGILVPQTLSEGKGYIPVDIMNFENLLTVKGFLFMIVGGFLVGFGTRYAGGCTSGHAISGLANLQIGSLIAVLGFFIGGLITTYLFFPMIFSL